MKHQHNKSIEKKNIIEFLVEKRMRKICSKTYSIVCKTYKKNSILNDRLFQQNSKQNRKILNCRYIKITQKEEKKT